ncbi:MAG: SdpI family protein [Dehalogenimonas sp.]|uniref:SdpI family protein n=1 Tax=Candidatus Dehalogenimonas loeffleri TaxID=3127115 RepID=A0ABZ2J5M8_9CHLR|nr:SdpI family protein [Dehalogenimonas sp.]
MKLNWRQEWPSLLLIAGMFIATALSWSSAPDSIPVHWGINGEVDRYGGKFEGLMLLPLLAVGIYLMLLFIPRIDPKRTNYERFANVYRIIRIVMLVFMAAIHGAIIAIVLGSGIDISLVVMVIVGLLLAILGNYFGKLKPTWFVGIRTPWTLTSDLSWDKTHRLGGRLFVILGLLLAASGIIGQEWAFYLVFGLMFAMIIYLVIYSYVVWKSDPDRRQGLTR